MEWLETPLSAIGLHVSDVTASLLVAFIVYGAAQTRQFASACLVLLAMLVPSVRRQRQRMISRRILTMVRSGDILQIELVNILANMMVAGVILAILIGLQLFEIKVALTEIHGYSFANASAGVLTVIADFGLVFKVAVALAGVYILFEIFEDAAVVRAALNVRYKGRDYLLEHRILFDPFAAGLIPRAGFFLVAFVFLLLVLVLR